MKHMQTFRSAVTLPEPIDGKNAWHVNVEGEHEWKVWFTDMYNALPLMFQETD